MTAAPSVSHFRGHLFADLRGSTAFTERAGNAAGADLVRRFRQLVRDAVGDHSGAEVKSEGDAVYVVFPSASTAVMCGLSIVAKAAQESEANPDAPILVGVGVHAGEAVEVPEGGYIGTAVNLAARVCSVAEAGEVLVTGTVRGIAQASIPVTFVPRGKRRLKGITEPVDLYLVVGEGIAVPSTRGIDRRLVVGAAGVAVLVVLAIAFLAFPGASGPPAAPATPTPVPIAHPRIGPLDIGEYVTNSFQPRYTFAITDRGWSLVDETSSKIGFLYDRDLGGKVDVGQISTVYSNPCAQGGESLPAVNTSQDLVAALQALDTQQVVHLGKQTPLSVGDHSGVSIELSVDTSVLAACDAGGGVAIFPLGGNPYLVQPGVLFKVDALDVGGTNVSFVSASNGTQDTSVTEIAAFFTVARRLVDSVRF